MQEALKGVIKQWSVPKYLYPEVQVMNWLQLAQFYHFENYFTILMSCSHLVSSQFSLQVLPLGASVCE